MKDIRNFKLREIVYIYLNDWDPPEDHPVYMRVLKALEEDDGSKFPLNYALALYDMSTCYFITTTPEDLWKLGWESLLSETIVPGRPCAYFYSPYNPDGSLTGIRPKYNPKNPGFDKSGASFGEIEGGYWGYDRKWHMKKKDDGEKN